MERVVISADELSHMSNQKKIAESKKGVKQGTPWDDIVNLEDENSVFSQYYKRKVEEYHERIHEFDEKMIEITKARETGSNEDGVVIAGGEDDYDGSSFESEYDKPANNNVNVKIIDNLF